MNLLNHQQFAVESHTVAAAYAGWLLRQFGAAVEHASALDPEGIGAFLAEGARFVPDPVASGEPGSTLITDAAVTAAQRERLESLARERLVVWITPWGLQSPWAERPASDLTLQAAGGWMAAVGEPGREPLAAPNSQAFLVAGLYAAITALAPTLRQLDAGRPRTGLIDVSIAESVLATTIYDVVSFQYTGAVRQRAGNRFSAAQPILATLSCKDGHIGLHAALYRQWLRLCDLIGHPELVTDPRFADPANRARNVAELDGYLLPWFAKLSRFEAYHTLQGAGIPASAHPSLAEVLDSDHLRARDWWNVVRTPSGRELKVPGAPARVLVSQPGNSAVRADGPWERGKVRVVDLAMGWAGPLVSHILACRGADVIKVESHDRFDWWRGSRPPGDDPELVLYERSHVFNSVNRGKRGLTLNLSTDRGRELAVQLIETADVVVENYAAGVLEKLGLAYEVLSARNPSLVMLRQPAFGSTGPESSYLAFGNTIEGMSGLTGLMGYEGGGPMMMSSAFGDPVNGLVGAVSVLSALAARDEDGRGRCIEAPQVEAFLPMVSEALIDYQRTGVLPGRAGNARHGDSPCAAFPCAEPDTWLCIHVRSDAEWTALVAQIGEDWANDPRFADREQREAHRRHLESRLARWTSGQARDALADRLANAGIAVAPVYNEADVLSMEPFASSGFFWPEERAHVGVHLYPGLPISVDGERFLPPGPAPTLGQDNGSVLAAMGYSAEAIAGLRAEGIIGERPD